jgi:hypothetical protein
MVGKNLTTGNGRAGPSPTGMHSQDKFRLNTLTYITGSSPIAMMKKSSFVEAKHCYCEMHFRAQRTRYLTRGWAPRHKVV